VFVARVLMNRDALDPAEFVQVAGMALSRGGTEELARRVQIRWTPRQVCPILSHGDPDVRKLACVVLALCGDKRVTGSLIRTLRDTNPQVVQLAEQAIWSIWFRSGTLEARRPFCAGLNALGNNPSQAILHFQQAQRLDSRFTEAFHQCGTAWYLREKWVEAIEQHERAFSLDMSHFGAMAGLGHCHFQLGNFAEAGRWYRRAVNIHPRLEAAKSALDRIQTCMASF
jgi:hypothetical protein